MRVIIPGNKAISTESLFRTDLYCALRGKNTRLRVTGYGLRVCQVKTALGSEAPNRPSLRGDGAKEHLMSVIIPGNKAISTESLRRADHYTALRGKIQGCV